jgi:tRNA(fMet)-specific endonuclease VapC
MTWFLDTNICIYLLKGTYPKIREELLSRKPSEIKIPSIVLAELYVGAEASKDPDATLLSVRKFVAPFEVAPFDEPAAESYGKIMATLIGSKLKVGPNDLAIAAIVASRDGILVTNNEKGFARAGGLAVENWI